MRILALVALMLATTAVLAPRPAAAAYNYPWCATYYDASRGMKSCMFTSFEQCMATISGIGGICGENPFYQPPPPYAARRPKKSRLVGNH